MRSYTRVSAALFALIALAQLTRALLGWPAQVGSFVIPVWFSVVACLITGTLAIWGLRVSRAA